MALMSSFFLLLSSSLLLLIANAQERAPHGLVYENPAAFPPSAVEFFHPKGQETRTGHPCTTSSSCSPLPVAFQLEDTKAQESYVPTSRSGVRQMGGGGVASIVFCSAFVVVLAMGAYYVFIMRRANKSRAISVQEQPDA
ncbi:hypothetical protein K2173_023529 [Erythroxylum novogranatense]|uniref:Transmembrane protein n=1 Tax=Erythroxylum novogranatense TaxID=1862640 RepID=A0AAV8TNV7_9ROSI|nr:hypothetical protein K2173_023529 [Erythroxylum novogranatense]